MKRTSKLIILIASILISYNSAYAWMDNFVYTPDPASKPKLMYTEAISSTLKREAESRSNAYIKQLEEKTDVLAVCKEHEKGTGLIGQYLNRKDLIRVIVSRATEPYNWNETKTNLPSFKVDIFYSKNGKINRLQRNAFGSSWNGTVDLRFQSPDKDFKLKKDNSLWAFTNGRQTFIAVNSLGERVLELSENELDCKTDMYSQVHFTNPAWD